MKWVKDGYYNIEMVEQSLLPRYIEVLTFLS